MAFGTRVRDYERFGGPELLPMLVASLGAEWLDEIFEVRRQAGSLVAAQAAVRAEPAERERLRSLLDQLAGVSDANAALIECKMHRVIAGAIRNRVYRLLVNALLIPYLMVRDGFQVVFADPVAAADRMALLVEQICAGSRDGAHAAAHTYLAQTENRMLARQPAHRPRSRSRARATPHSRRSWKVRSVASGTRRARSGLTSALSCPPYWGPLSDLEGSMKGRVGIAGLADDPDATGNLRVAPLAARRTHYRLAFAGEYGRQFRLEGWKSIDLRHPVRSMTRLPATISDAKGTVVGQARLWFRIRRDLARFLVGFRFPTTEDQAPARSRGKPGELEVRYTTLSDPATGTRIWIQHALAATAAGRPAQAQGATSHLHCVSRGGQQVRRGGTRREARRLASQHMFTVPACLAGWA